MKWTSMSDVLKYCYSFGVMYGMLEYLSVMLNYKYSSSYFFGEYYSVKLR